MTGSDAAAPGMRRVTEAERGIWRALDFWGPPGA